MKRTAIFMAILLVLGAFAVAASGAPDAISTSFANSTELTNSLGRGYEIESVWFSPSAETSQTITLSVVVDGVEYGQKALTVAGDTAWTANQIILVPSGAVLKLASDQAAVTNSIYLLRSEVSTTRTFIDGELADGEVDTAELAADAVTGAQVADEAIDSEHYTDGSIDREHLAADVIDGTKIDDDAVDSEHIAAGAVDAEHVSIVLSDLSPTGDDGGFFQVTGNALEYVSAGGVTNAIDADITAE